VRTLVAVATGLVAGLALGLAVHLAPDAESVELRARVAELESTLAEERAGREREAREAGLARARSDAELERLDAERLRLLGELETALEERVAREADFVEFTELLSQVVPAGAPPEVHALLGQEAPPPAEEEPSPAPDPQDQALRAREAELASELRALLVTERLDALQLLELGRLGEGHVGPVVLRTLDERGRPVGTLVAERLRLEGSRAGRSLTLVLEEGYEREGTRRFPFEGTPPGAERGGVRRLLLPQTRPEPWMRSCPELFDPEALSPVEDDGTWRLALVQRALNGLLEGDTELGYHRVVALGGVTDGELRAVELEQLDRHGRLVKRLLADRLRIAPAERGVELELRDGVQVRGERKDDFLLGRYRIFLPGARVEDWRAAGLPGLVPVAESALAAG
jgi:hypothetical protein